MDLHTLTKMRAAHKSTDGAEGFVYLHQWPQGFQQVIFENEKIADGFLKALNDQNKPKVDVSTLEKPTARFIECVAHSGSNTHAGEA